MLVSAALQLNKRSVMEELRKVRMNPGSRTLGPILLRSSYSLTARLNLSIFITAYVHECLMFHTKRNIKSVKNNQGTAGRFKVLITKLAQCQTCTEQ